MASVVWLNAGDLNPPVGPVTGTMKTLSEVEPRIAITATNTPGDADSLFKITQPGSYYLTGSFIGFVGKHGVEIAASGVTLDLNGFDLLGGAGSLNGVSVTVGGQTNIAVVNGSVRLWGGDGVDLTNIGATNCRVEGLLTSGNSGVGIRLGIGCTVSNCSAYNNNGNGILTDNDSTVWNCSSYNNNGDGILTLDDCTVSNCSTYDNNANGFRLADGCTVWNCSSYFNSANGIRLGTGCTVSNCSAYDNNVNGISTTDGCTVADCTVRDNGFDGINCNSGCVIRGNTCSFNGNGGDGAGIHTTGDDNRIEGNNCTTADRGIDVDAGGNLIIRNSASGNTTNYDIVGGNFTGTIVATEAAMNAATNSNVNIAF